MTNEIIISNTNDLIRVSANDILAIIATGNYCFLYLTDGKEQLVTYQLGQVEQMIAQQLQNADDIFIRVGRGVMINLDYLFFISIPRQLLVVKTSNNIQKEFTPSKESLRKVKQFIEQRIEIKTDSINE